MDQNQRRPASPSLAVGVHVEQNGLHKRLHPIPIAGRPRSPWSRRCRLHALPLNHLPDAPLGNVVAQTFATLIEDVVIDRWTDRRACTDHARMKATPRESAAAQRLAESLIEFIVAIDEGMAQRRAQRPRDEIKVRVEQPPKPQPGSQQTSRPAVATKPEQFLLSSKEAATRLGVGARTIWSMTAPRGPLPTVRIGNRTLYSIADLEAVIERLKISPHPRERTPFERANPPHH